MTDQEIEREILLWALDGDTIQHLLAHGRSKWQIGLQEILDKVRLYAQKGFLTFNQYVEGGIDVQLNPEKLTLDYLQGTHYTFIVKTEQTIQRLNELYKDNPEKGSDHEHS